MSRVPFKNFIITFLLFNKSISFIIEKLKGFGYHVEEKEITDIFDDLKSILPSALSELIVSGGVFNPIDEIHAQWLKQFDVFEFYDFIYRRDTEKDPPEHFKWCNDCLWIHSYKDTMCLVNILLFNNEILEDISKIVMFKYKKKIGIDALKLYQKTFWNIDSMTAKEALYYCSPFRQNTLVIRKMRSGESDILAFNEDADLGSDIPITLHDSNYIKWKIGYKDITAPNAKDFIEQIKRDSYFKYYEAMNMTQSIESESEEGNNEQFGSFTKDVSRRKNLEEQRVKLAKSWLDMYLKANDAMPGGESETKDFFKKMQQLHLDFGEPEDEKIARIEDIPNLLNDIKGDLS